MSVQVENLEKNMVKLTITVEAADFEKAVEKAYQKSKGQIVIPGFRKGKAPRKMIEKMYGQGVFFEDAANECLPDAYEAAVKESGLTIVSEPQIDAVQLEPGKDFIFTATAAKKPEVKIEGYKGIEVPKTEIVVTDEDIDAEIESVRKRNARQVSVDRAAENGDTAVIDFEGFVDDVPFDGGKGENYSLKLGSGSFIPGFEEQVVGHKAGEEFDVNVTFPENYQAKELQGADAVFKIVLHDVKAEELPEVDDDFASDVSEYETLDEYKESLKKTIAERKENTAKTAKEDKAVEILIEKAEMEIPDAMIESQAKQMVNDFANQLQSQGMSISQYLQFTGMTAESMLDTMKPQAQKRIESRLVLEAVADAEGMTASDEEVDAEIKTMADSYGMEVENIKNFLQDTDLENMREDIKVRKALDLVVAEAVEVEMPEETAEADAE